MRRAYGLESAQDVAGHVRFGRTIDDYDEESHADFGFFGAHLGNESMSRTQIRAQASCTSNRIYTPTEGEPTLIEALAHEVTWRHELGVTDLSAKKALISGKTFRQAQNVLNDVPRDYFCYGSMDMQKAVKGCCPQLQLWSPTCR
jgi:hypothetical protein